MSSFLQEDALFRLTSFEGLVITVKSRSLCFKYNNLEYSGIGSNAFEAIIEAYLFFKSNELAVDLVKKAEIKLPGDA